MFDRSAVKIVILAILAGMTGCLGSGFQSVRSEKTGKEYSVIPTSALDRGPTAKSLEPGELLITEKSEGYRAQALAVNKPKNVFTFIKVKQFDPCK